MSDILKNNPNLLDTNYLLSIHDIGDADYNSLCGPLLPEHTYPKGNGLYQSTHPNYLNLMFADCDYKINWYTYPMQEEQAEQVVEFFKSITAKEDTILYINCLAGVSRSGGVGWVARQYFQLDYDQFKRDNPQIVPNQQVIKMLHAKLAGDKNMPKPEVQMEDWSVHEDAGAAYCLSGRVVNHPRFKEGHAIVTSSIVKVIDQETIETANTIYKLGAVSPAYKFHFLGHKLTSMVSLDLFGRLSNV